MKETKSLKKVDNRMINKEICQKHYDSSNEIFVRDNTQVNKFPDLKQKHAGKSAKIKAARKRERVVGHKETTRTIRTNK